MTALRTGVLLAVVMVAAAGAVSGEPAGQRRASQTAAAQAPQKDGWWIRVNPSSAAANLYWRFGTQGRLGAPINWVKGKNPEVFDLPAAQKQLDAIDIAALALPAESAASFCVFFKEQGIALFEFMREKNVTIDRQMRAPECTP
jgi:hypothetical protein